MSWPVFLTTLGQAVNAPSLPKVEADAGLGAVSNIAFAVLGGISLIIVVLQGVRYTLSQGDSQKLNQARNGIIYALVGIVVATTGYSLVNYALDQVVIEDKADVSTISSMLVSVAGVIALVGGVIAVIMVIIGAVRFVASGDNPQATAAARNTIIYALIGALVAMMAGPLLAYFLDILAQ